MEGEVGVKREEKDEPLANGAGGAQHSCKASMTYDRIFGHGIDLPHFFLGKFLFKLVKFWASMFAWWEEEFQSDFGAG